MSAQPRPVRPIEPHVPQAGGVRLRWEDATTTDGKQSVLPEMTNHTPVRSDELRIDFERRSIDTQTYATAVGAGGKRVCVRQGFMALRVRSSLSCSTCVCEMTTLRSRIHTESTRGSAVPILANMFVYRCHFGTSFESLRNFVSPTLLSLVISQIFLCFQSARVPTGKQSVLPEMTNHTPVRSDELRIDFERRSIDTETYATAVGAGGKRICVRQGFMALRVRSSLSYGRTRRQKFACFGQFSRTSMASATKT